MQRRHAIAAFIACVVFVCFKLHLVDTRTGELAADLVVEVKGPQKALTPYIPHIARCISG